MKKPILIFLFFCLLIFEGASFGFTAYKKEKKLPADPAMAFAVVELFTSEGCSSCPPADDAVSAIIKEYPDQVYVLGFHVDYWNHLGWKDAFSMAAFSERQRQYAEVFDLNSIYTPQIVVNGITQFTGSDKNKLQNTVASELNKVRTVGIQLNASCNDQKNVLVNYKVNAAEKGIVNIALVQLHATSAVSNGENKGRNLTHINIVRAFKTFAENMGSASFVIPNGLSSKDCKIIAFVQDKSSMHITGAGQTPVN
jgi:hypothetical protein